MRPSQLEKFLGKENHPSEVWLSCKNFGYIARLNELGEPVELRFRTEATEGKSRDLTALFVRQILGDIAQCCIALGMNNFHSVEYLSSLESSGSKEAADATTELIFGGGIAAATLHERNPDIPEICAELQSEKVPFVAMKEYLK